MENLAEKIENLVKFHVDDDVELIGLEIGKLIGSHIQEHLQNSIMNGDSIKEGEELIEAVRLGIYDAIENSGGVISPEDAPALIEDILADLGSGGLNG